MQNVIQGMAGLFAPCHVTGNPNGDAGGAEPSLRVQTGLSPSNSVPAYPHGPAVQHRGQRAHHGAG